MRGKSAIRIFVRVLAIRAASMLAIGLERVIFWMLQDSIGSIDNDYLLKTASGTVLEHFQFGYILWCLLVVLI
jgi:hypothetical protein